MVSWAEAHYEKEKTNILRDVITAQEVDEYRRHWKAIIPFEIRANVTDCIEELLYKCKKDPSLRFSEDIDFQDFVSDFVEKVNPNGKLLNLICRNTNPSLCKRVAKEFQGRTLCAGYVSGRYREEAAYTNLALIACRRVSWDECDVAPMGDTDTIADMVMHLVVDRNGYRDIGVRPGNTVHLLQLCHFSPFLGMYKAVELPSSLPRYMHNVLFGNNCPTKMTDDDHVQHFINIGSATYLAGLQPKTRNMDKCQFESIRAVLANIGDGNINSSSFSTIHGPPGTCKTTTIINLLGALLDHSKIGHVDREQMHMFIRLVPNDEIVRCRKQQLGVRILVCSSSNKAVENVLERIYTGGIPDGKEGFFWPQVVRMARSGYDHCNLV